MREQRGERDSLGQFACLKGSWKDYMNVTAGVAYCRDILILDNLPPKPLISPLQLVEFAILASILLHAVSRQESDILLTGTLEQPEACPRPYNTFS